MSRKYVLDGAIVKCSAGMKPAKLMVVVNRKVKIQGKFKATNMDKLVPQTFLLCKLKPTSGGFLPCIPALQKWQKTSTKTTLRGVNEFLFDDSYTMCGTGGRVTIVNHTQINAAGAVFEQYANISTTIPGAMPLQDFDEGTLPEDDSSNGFLDGFQTVLDIAGLVPGFGEIADGINAAIYVARGDYANAALSAAAMIPIGGQAATAAKLGLKGADAAKTAVKSADEVADTAKAMTKNADDLPPGTFRDKSGKLRNKDGTFAKDTNAKGKSKKPQYSRSGAERKKALLRDANDPNSDLTPEAREFIKKHNGEKVPERYEVSHEIPLYVEPTKAGKKELDVSDNMLTQPKDKHRARHKKCGDQYHEFGPANKPK